MSLTWEGLDLQPAHRRWRFWIEQGRDELPDMRTSSDLIPFRRGRLHRQAVADRRVLEVRGYIQEASLSAFRAQHDTLKGLLDPTAAAPGRLIDDFEDGTVRWIRAVPRNLMSRHGGEATRLLSVELEALDPYWYSPIGSLSLDAGLLLDSGYELDSSAEIIVTGAESLFDVIVEHPGTADSELISIRMTGASTSAVGVENLTAGVGFSAGIALATGESLAVDVRGRTIERDGTSVRSTMTLLTSNRNGEWLRLRPGTNRLRILGVPAETRLLYNPTWQ